MIEEALRVKFIGPEDSKIRSVVFSPDGKRIASAQGDNTAKIWDAATGMELMTLRGHGNAVCSVAFSPDGKRLVTGGAGWSQDMGFVNRRRITGAPYEGLQISCCV